MWWASNPAKLSPDVLALMQDPHTTAWLSVVSVWEILIKLQLGKLSMSSPLTLVLAQQQTNGIQLLPVALEHVLAVESLPAVHKDPFDRLLIAQEKVEDMTLISVDAVFSQYPVRVFW